MDNTGFDLEIAQEWLKNNPVPSEGVQRLDKKRREEMLSAETKQLIAESKEEMAKFMNRFDAMYAHWQEERRENERLQQKISELQFVNEWVRKTLAFIKEKGDDIKRGFIADHCLEGTAHMCLERMKEHGWKFTPQIEYDPMTTHIHLVPIDFVDN